MSNHSKAGEAASRAATPSTREMQQLWDAVSILKRLGNDQLLLDELIEIYLADIEPLVRGLQSAVAARDMENIARHAHNIKGLASNFGVNSVTMAAGELELKARLKNWSQIHILIERLAQELSRMHRSLPELHSRRPANTSPRDADS